MQPLSECPACEGRGKYCEHVADPAWSELVLEESPCLYCNGTGKISLQQVIDYDPDAQPLRYPYKEA